ncbi:MAG: DinB family protein [Planctomycetota bacterium]
MLSEAIKAHRTLRGYNEKQLADLSDEEFFAQPVAGMNHAAWNLGHLAFYMDVPAGLLGVPTELDGWKGLFAQGSSATAGPEGYPSRGEIVAAFEGASDRLTSAIEAATAEQFAAPNTVAMAESLPTIGDLMEFLVVGHFALHGGQISAWRRTLGREPLF